MDTQISTGLFALINLTVVFAVLIILAVVIQLIKLVAYKKPDDSSEKKTSVTEPAEKTGGATVGKSVSEENIQAKAAAACAAIAASLDGTPHRIVSIKRLTPQSLWIQSARMENITSNAMLRHRR